MNISHNTYDAIEGLILSEGLRIISVKISPENDKLYIHLNTDVVFQTATKKYLGLKNASGQELQNYRLIGNGIGIHWTDLDEDLSLKGFLKDFLSHKLKTKKTLIIA